MFTDKGDPKLLTTAVISMVVGINDWFHQGRGMSIEEVADGHVQIVLDLLGARRRRP